MAKEKNTQNGTGFSAPVKLDDVPKGYVLKKGKNGLLVLVKDDKPSKKAKK